MILLYDGFGLALCELALLRNIRVTLDLVRHGDTETRKHGDTEITRRGRGEKASDLDRVRLAPLRAWREMSPDHAGIEQPGPISLTSGWPPRFATVRRCV